MAELNIPVVETYKPFPKQKQFHLSPAKYRLFGGAAGPGKTKALLWEGIMQAHDLSGVNTLLLRRTYPELESSLLMEFHRGVPREMYRSFNEAKHIVYWHNGSITRFGYCQRENDVYQYQGAEYVFIGVDELTHFTLRQWQYLTSRNRCPVYGAFPCMAGATNPGNIGHKWVKGLWIDKKPPDGMEGVDQYDPKDYEFISALISDNPIYAVDKNYLKALNALPTALRDALLKGMWDVFAGQFFDCWSAATMVDECNGTSVVHSPDWKLDPWLTRWITIDWGFEHPSAVYWMARSGDHVYCYREFVQNKLTPRMLAQAICERSVRDVPDAQGRDRTEVETISSVFLSPDAFASRTGEATIAEQIGEVFARGGIPRPQAADNDRIGGWMLMYQMLSSGFLRIGSNCTKLIECIPSLVRDEKKVEDVAKMDGDDPADSCRYGLKSMLSPGRVPLAQRVKERLESQFGALEQVKPENYTHVMMQRASILQQEGKHEGPYFIGGRRRR